MNKSVILKITGNILLPELRDNIFHLAKQINILIKNNIQVGIVIGGGNIIRGREIDNTGLDRITADQIGMLSTVINSLQFKSISKDILDISIYGSFSVEGIIKRYMHQDVIKDFSNNVAVMFAGGTGLPLCSTDSLAVIKAFEIFSNTVYKLGEINGIYDKNPGIEGSKIVNFMSCEYAIKNNISIMDRQAYIYAHENKIDIYYTNINYVNLVDIILNNNLNNVCIIKS